MRNTFLCAPATLLVLIAGSVLAQAPPDWTGFYTLASPRDLMGTGLKQDAPGEALNKLITPYLQPWAKARMEATDGVADDTGQVCLPDGIFRYPSMAGRFVWLQEHDRIVMAFQNINTAGVRRLYLNRPHPKNPIPTWNGDSIAHWDGDTLLVDSVGFNDKSWLFGGMQPHTEEAHLIERMKMVANGAILNINITVEDRHALTSAYSYNRFYKRQPAGVEMPEDVCNEDPDTWKQFRDEKLNKLIEKSRIVK